MEYIVIIIGSYLLGSLMTGFFVAKALFGNDIRKLGSTNVGARNAGTLFGKKAFIFTALGDGLKGLIAVFIIQYLGFSIELQALGLLFVLIGHLFPIFLKFHGGKGIATFIGSLLMFDYVSFLVFLAAFALFALLTRSATISVMLAFLSIPIFSLATYESIFAIIIMSIAVALLLVASRENIAEKFSK